MGRGRSLEGSLARGAGARLASAERWSARFARAAGRAGGSYFTAACVVAACAAFSWFVLGRSALADVAMIHLLGVTAVSMRFGYGPSILAVVLSAGSFEFFFIPPSFSFAVANLRHAITCAVMLFVALVVSHLARRVRDQADASNARERRTASLYALSREIGLAHGRRELVGAAARQVREMFGARVALLVAGGSGRLETEVADGDALDVCVRESAVAQWAWTHERQAGRGTDAHSGAMARYVPLKGSGKCAGVLALLPFDPLRFGDPDEDVLLLAVAGLVGSALDRTRLADEARHARLRAEAEQLRNALLSSVSHDLRTPLAVITGATSTLLEQGGPRDEGSRRRLVETAHEEALRLARLVRNLLDMTRLQAGEMHVHTEPQSLEEVVGSALTRLEDRLQNRDVITSLPDDLPLVAFDSVLIEQVFFNLIDNAIKYSPDGAPLEVAVRLSDTFAEIEVADRGPGVSPDDRERIFEKFYRAREQEGGGVGLGLAICRGIVAAHAGRIWVEPRQGGGASFRFTLPLEPAASALPTGTPRPPRLEAG